jgi:PilZ domain
MLGALQQFSVISRGAPDRRANDRFPIIREVRYKVINSKGTVEVGTGETINISSTGVLFKAQAPLPPGKRLEISISWPAQLDGKCGLKLVARGRILRCHGTTIALEIDKYEFRTAGRVLSAQTGI